MLFAFEGIDGSGKGTQASLCAQRARNCGLKVEMFSFPAYGTNAFSLAVGEYLNGRYGGVDDVDPRFVALLYAGDRFAMRDRLYQACTNADVVICDRYVPSNLAYQAAKLPRAEWKAFFRWLRNIEYGTYKLPYASIILLLEMPVDAATGFVLQKRTRPYTKLKADIHERDVQYQARCAKAYRGLAERTDRDSVEKWVRIQCATTNGTVRESSLIANEIWRIAYQSIQ